MTTATATATITTMVDPTVYLEKMSAFSRQLREAGLIVSPQETADACQLMITMGLADRSQVKTMLTARFLFAKSSISPNKWAIIGDVI